MDSITNAQTVAAVWFIVFFGACMLAPLFMCDCRKHDTEED